MRGIAKKKGLATAEKEESQGVCFIGEFNMEDFLKKYIKLKKGKVVAPDGKIIGEHNGLAFYTIGQRHGFGFGGGEGGPYYVVEKDFKNNRLIVAEKKRRKNSAERKLLLKTSVGFLLFQKLAKISGEDKVSPAAGRMRSRGNFQSFNKNYFQKSAKGGYAGPVFSDLRWKRDDWGRSNFNLKSKKIKILSSFYS